MQSDRSMFEIYLEILTQIKLGNTDEESITRCTNLSQNQFYDIIEPLVSEKLLKRIKRCVADKQIIVYELSDRGIQFIDYLMLGIHYAEEPQTDVGLG